VSKKATTAAVAVSTPSALDTKKTGKENVKDTIKAMAIETGLSSDIASQSSKAKGKALLLHEEDFPALNSPALKSTAAVATASQSKAATKSVTAASKKVDKQKEKLERLAEKAARSIEEAEKKKAAEKASGQVSEKSGLEKAENRENTDKAVVAPQPSEAPPKTIATVSDKTEKRPVPGILNIAAATRSTQGAVDAPVVTDSAVKSVPDKESAFPALPTPSSASSFTPAIRTAPKTLRVVSTAPTPKTENPSSAVPSSVRSVSINRSETPGSEAISDSASVISAGVSLSRTSSPPPSRVGTAPVRSTTKSQQRKARKEAVKKDVGVIVATPKIEPEEIGPIMGRKKKQKKEKATPSSSATPTVSRPETPVTEKKDPIPAPPQETKDDSSTYRSVAYETMSLTEDTPPVRGKAADLKGKAKDNEVSSAALSLQTQISPATVFRQLIEDNYYPEGVEALNFIKPVASSNDKHRHDQGSASQAARDLLDKNLIEPQAKSIVQEEDQAILLEGRPVRKLVDGLRVMLTPYGDCVRNLSPDEEERYLELQERVAEEASSPAVFVASRHEPSPGFSLIKGRAVPNGPPGYFPQAPGAFPQDPVNKIQREEAIYYINQYVLPRLNLGTTGFPGPWKNALQDGKVNLNAATANFNSTIAPYIDTAAPELSYPVPSPGGSSVGLADTLPGHQNNSHSQNLASVLVNSLGPWPEPAHGGPSGAKFTGSTTSGGPFGSVPLMSQEDAEQALAAARKETDKLEKQLNQKIKKNRQFLNIDNNAAKLGMLTTAH
jgi:CCR4-NOT transcription complex subunit 4